MMAVESRPQRRTQRLVDRSYTEPGVYFVTIRAFRDTAPFGSLHGSGVELTDLGLYAARLWQTIPARYAAVRVDRFVFMPDHMHGILIITGPAHVWTPNARSRLETDHPAGTNAGSIGAILQGFKGGVTTYHRRTMGGALAPLWQRGYYDRVVRDAAELSAVRRYIMENPARAWEGRA